MKTHLPLLILLSFIACNQTKEKVQDVESTPAFQNKGHELVYQMMSKTGGYEELKSLVNVVYTYTYRTADGKEDVSTEQYLFDGELSYGDYRKHERTLPSISGQMTQGFDGNEFWLSQSGETIEDIEVIKKVAFTRKTNFFWFAMMQKMLDPGINYKYLREEILDSIQYNVVEISYNVPEGILSDTYHLYINRSTSLVDQFLFTVVDHGFIDTPLLMRVQYEEFEGMLFPTYRKYTQSTWDAEVLKDVWVEEISTDLRFNQDIGVEDFQPISNK